VNSECPGSRTAQPPNGKNATRRFDGCVEPTLKAGRRPGYGPPFRGATSTWSDRSLSQDETSKGATPDSPPLCPRDVLHIKNDQGARRGPTAEAPTRASPVVDEPGSAAVTPAGVAPKPPSPAAQVSSGSLFKTTGGSNTLARCKARRGNLPGTKIRNQGRVSDARQETVRRTCHNQHGGDCYKSPTLAWAAIQSRQWALLRHRVRTQPHGVVAGIRSPKIHFGTREPRIARQNNPTQPGLLQIAGFYANCIVRGPPSASIKRGFSFTQAVRSRLNGWRPSSYYRRCG